MVYQTQRRLRRTQLIHSEATREFGYTVFLYSVFSATSQRSDKFRRRFDRVCRRTPLHGSRHVGACRQRIELCRRTSHVRSSDIRHNVDSRLEPFSTATTVVDRFPCFGRIARVSTAVVANCTSRRFKTGGVLVQPLYRQFSLHSISTVYYINVEFTSFASSTASDPSDVISAITVSVCGPRCLLALLLVDREARPRSAFWPS
jgi:hypothetical protein